jgi:hypothetical protein
MLEDGIEWKGNGAFGVGNVPRRCVLKEYDRKDESKGDYELGFDMSEATQSNLTQDTVAWPRPMP